MNTVKDIDPNIAKTHAVLFDTWFPIEQLPIPPAIAPDIANIAAQVSAGMLQAFSQSGFFPVLIGLTYPTKLPFYTQLQSSQNPAVQAFLKATGGYGGLAVCDRHPLFSYLFDGDLAVVTAQFAMIIREAYLSGIWDLPLAVPITEIQPPQVFMQNPEIYAKRHAPVLPPSHLRYDAATQTIQHQDGAIDYLVIGSGPGGAAVCHELQKAGKRVVLIEKGPFVVWGSMDTRSYSRLLFRNDQASTVTNSVIIRSGETMGGGSTVNIDLAFSPLAATIQSRIGQWIAQGLLDAEEYSPEKIAVAYQRVRQDIGTREVSQDELNQDNQVLWNGAKAFGVDPSLYHLNRFPTGLSPSPVDDKLDAARQLLRKAMQDTANPLGVICDASVDQIQFTTESDGKTVQATGVALTINSPWTDYGNTVVDPSNLQIPPGTTVSIAANAVVLAAGTIGTTRVLLNSAKSTPAIANSRIGKGLILHPSVPLIGIFDQTINLLEGLDSATFVEAFGPTPGFIYETMGGLPAYGALLVPGNGQDVYNAVSQFGNCAGFGTMLVDTPSDDNCVSLDDQGNVMVQYNLSEPDKQRFRAGVAIGIRMMFMAGAKQVIIPSNENFLNLPNFDPMVGVVLTESSQADLVEQNLQFIPNRTLLTAAHLQATNKIGLSPNQGVVSTNQRVWNVLTGAEVPNLYVMDSSIFPTSVGANPMQSIYTFAYLFCDRLLQGMEQPQNAIAAT